MNMKDMLAVEFGEEIVRVWDDLAEIRVRANQSTRFRKLDGGEQTGLVTDAQAVQRIACRLMENSIYAREEELKQGYFTASDGCRVGICGRLVQLDGKVTTLSSIGSLCIRIPREVKGCAQKIISSTGGNLLILSPPGMGKTTLIRDYARLLSDGGINVAVADERSEICACREGVPQLDVGSRTDVMDGCAKAIAIPMLIRACAPNMIIADEIGTSDDASALRDASRCGIRICATAHASAYEEAAKRRYIGELLAEGIFDYVVLLGDKPGKVLEIIKMTGGEKKCSKPSFFQ